MAEKGKPQEGPSGVFTQSEGGTSSGGQQESGRPHEQTDSEAVQQARHDALSPDQKHKNYLDDLERLHNESRVTESGRTVA